MSISSDDLKGIFAGNTYYSNRLQAFDNVTYNIRFYMLNHDFQKRLSEERLNGIGSPDSYIIPDTEKIIIAETGVSTHYDITSLNIKAVHASAERNPSAVTYQVDMRIREVDGVDLVNRITAVSHKVGYPNYILQPFHIDVWFTGYEHGTGKPIRVIDDKVYTYEVILSEVKTQVDSNGCTYNFIMTPVPKASMDKYIKTAYQLGEIKPDSDRGGTYGGYVDRLVELINKKFMNENPSIKNYYTDGKYLYVDSYKVSTGNGYETSVPTSGESSSVSSSPSSNQAELYPTQQSSVPNSNGTFSGMSNVNMESYYTAPTSVVPSVSSKSSFGGWANSVRSDTSATPTVPMPMAQNVSPESVSTIDVKNVRVKEFIGKQTTDKKDDGPIQFDASMTFEQILQELCFHTDELNTYVVRPNYRIKNIANVNGMEVREVHADIIFTKNEYLEYFKEKAKAKNNPSSEESRIKQMQSNEARNLVSNGLMPKRYEWLFNGRDTSVLEFNGDLDKLWYANLGWENTQTIDEAVNDVPRHADKEKDEYSEMSLGETLTASNEKLVGNEARGLSSDGRLYLDDIYKTMDESTRREYLSARPIYEKNDAIANSNKKEESEQVDIEAVMTKAGYGNLHGSGNLVEVTLKILGDPFWMHLYDDKVAYAPSENSEFNKFYHFVFIVKTPISQTPSGEYDIHSCIEFSTIYQIIESSSLMEDGKFIQSIKGVVDPAFMHLARIEGLDGGISA